MQISQHYQATWIFPTSGTVKASQLREIVRDLNLTDVPDDIDLEVSQYDLLLDWDRGPAPVKKRARQSE